MRKIIIVLGLCVLFFYGCGSAKITFTNNTGHNQVYCIVTTDKAQTAKTLDNGQSMSQSGLSSQDVVLSANKTEYDSKYNVSWEVSTMQTVHISAGFVFNEGDNQFVVNSNGVIEQK